MTEKDTNMHDPEKHFQVQLETKLKNLGVWYRFIEKPESTVHTADASQVTGIELSSISKNLMAVTRDGRHVALIIPGDKRVDYKAASAALGTKSLSLVPFEDAHKISGYPPGGTPSLGYTGRLDVVVLDENLAGRDTFYCGGGSTRMLLELKKDDVVRLNNAIIAKISN